METFIISWFVIAVEACGSLYFFDIFLKQRHVGRFGKYRYWLLFLMIVVILRISRWIDMGIWKMFLMLPVFMVSCMLFYHVRWKQSFFLSGVNYSLIVLIDFLLMQTGNIWISDDVMYNKGYASQFLLLALVAKMTWLSLIFIFHKIWKGKNKHSEISNGEWLKLSMIPLFTLIALLTMIFFHSSEKKVQSVYLFLAVGLIIVNFIIVELMQSILGKEEQLRESTLRNQKIESQFTHYRDMQAVYERQGRKMHDYKNQIRTMQVLLKEGDIQTAAALAERLTESISVEMAAVNTNHPIVNAVLNQKFHAAREQGISMIFMVSDMSGLCLNEEETVILLSNLLDNAIHECIKVVQAEKKAVINVKLVYEDGNLIFSVKNPVAKKVEIVDGVVLDSDGRKHGIGLVNVKAVCDKYDGDFEIFCDSEKFQAVAML